MLKLGRGELFRLVCPSLDGQLEDLHGDLSGALLGHSLDHSSIVAGHRLAYLHLWADIIDLGSRCRAQIYLNLTIFQRLLLLLMSKRSHTTVLLLAKHRLLQLRRRCDHLSGILYVHSFMRAFIDLILFSGEVLLVQGCCSLRLVDFSLRKRSMGAAGTLLTRRGPLHLGILW